MKKEDKKELVTINPTTGKEIKRCPLMSDGEVENALNKCQEAFLDWRLVSHLERGKIISAIGEGLKENSEE